MRYLISTYFLTLALSGMSLANDFAANELLQMLSQDPSLLFDPESKIEVPPPVLPPPDYAREPQSEKEKGDIVEGSEGKTEVTPSEEAKGAEQGNTPDKVAEGSESEESKAEESNIEVSKSAEPKQGDQEKAQEVQDEVAQKEEIKPEPEEIKLEPPVEMAKETPVQVQPLPEPHVPSQLVALPGVNDFSIILSEKEFFPAMIKMKQSEKARLLFISTSSKPGALVFTKPQIQRWMEREPASTGLQITNEIHSTKVTQIEFSAEPGTYKFYDALSGASGEIQVE